MKNVLMVTQHFPPMNRSSTIRPFQFAKYLVDFGFYPIVLTQEDFTNGFKADLEQLKELEWRCKIIRVKPVVFDSGSYALKRFRRRERQLLTILKAVRIFLNPGFDIIWATGPPWGTLHAGYLLALLTRKPLVTDIRDPWTYGFVWQPASQKNARKEQKWEQRVLKKSSRIVYTSPLTTNIMKERSEKTVAERMVTITNGFSEHLNGIKRTIPKDKCLFCYVGNLFLQSREPSIVFEGLKLACREPQIAEDVRLQFIGGMDGFEQGIRRYGLEKQIEHLGRVSLGDSVRYMRGADVLVLLQSVSGEGCDVVGGKAYEYLAARKPILGIVPEDGGDAWLLQSTRAGVITGIDDPERVAQALRHYWRLWKDNKLVESVGECDISQFSRRNLAQDLAKLFEEVLEKKKFNQTAKKISQDGQKN